MPRQIKFNCNHCGAKLAVPPQMAGVSDYCPKCGGLIRSPTLAEWNAMLNAAAFAAQKNKPTESTPPLTQEEVSATASAETSSKAVYQTPEDGSLPDLIEQSDQHKVSLPSSPSAAPVPKSSSEASGWSAAELADALNPSVQPSSESSAPVSEQSDAFDTALSADISKASPPPSKPLNSPSEISSRPSQAGPSLLSRMLSSPQSLSKTPLQSSSNTSENQASLSSKLIGSESNSSELEDQDSDSSRLEEKNEDEDAPMGMGEMLARSNHSPAAPSFDSASSSGQDRKWRSTPFLSVDEISSSKARTNGFSRKVLLGLFFFLAFDCVMLAVFRKEVIQFWYQHGPGSWGNAKEQQASELPPYSETAYPSINISVPQNSDNLQVSDSTPSSTPELPPVQAEETPASNLNQPAKPRSEKPNPPASSEAAPTSTSSASPNPSPKSSPATETTSAKEITSGSPSPSSSSSTGLEATNPASSASVPQAIPITEEQLAKLPASSLVMSAPATTPNPPLPVPIPPTSPASSSSKDSPAANLNLNVSAITPNASPAAVSDAWVFNAPSTASVPKPVLNASPSKSATIVIPPTTHIPKEPPPSALDPSSVKRTTPINPETNKIPEEAKTAYASLLSFLNASNWKERATYSKRASALADTMAKHANTYGDGPIQVQRIDFIDRHIRDANAEPYCMFELSGGDLGHPVLALVSQPPKKAALVDWEAFMEFRHDYLLKFLENPSAPNQQFRVMLRRKHYFDKDVPNIDRKECFQITQPYMESRYEGNVFVNKDSQLSKTLASQLGWGLDMPVIVELTWKSNSNHKWVEIVSIPHYGWRNS